MDKRERPTPENCFREDHAILLQQSYYQLTGRDLSGRSETDPGPGLYFSSRVIVSHDSVDDPVFNYANQAALDLFEMDWETFTALPSRLSAEQPRQEERQRLLTGVAEKGFIDNYTGVRISQSGRRFFIRNATVWNVQQEGRLIGQAAVFDRWQYLE